MGARYDQEGTFANHPGIPCCSTNELLQVAVHRRIGALEMSKRLLEFPSHGNRVWHRCKKVYDVWSADPPEPIAVGRYVMMYEDVCDLDLTMTPEALVRNCLVPMYRMGGTFDREHPTSSCFGTLPTYVCPACERFFSLEEIESGRTVDFGPKESRSPSARRHNPVKRVMRKKRRTNLSKSKHKMDRPG